jgi:hypothetical protein
MFFVIFVILFSDISVFSYRVHHSVIQRVYLVASYKQKQSLFGIKLINFSLLYGEDKIPFITFIYQLKKNFKN